MNKKDILSEVTGHLDLYIEKCGQCWKHKLDKYTSFAVTIDKEFQSRIKVLVKRDLKPRNGVLNYDTSSAFAIVSCHAVSDFILHFDIRRYYESIGFEPVERFLIRYFNEEELDFIKKFYFSDNGLRRGLFASPVISEIVGYQIDKLVAKIIYEHGWNNRLKYSRYYDDLIFSGLGLEELRTLEQDLVKELGVRGLAPNNKKTKILRNTSMKLLGLRIHNGKVMVPKSFRNKLRLRQHYAGKLLEQVKAGNYDCVEDAMAAVGSVVGSLRYVIDNSEQLNDKYQSLLELYCGFFVKLRNLRDGLRDDENPFILEDAEKAALDMINSKRRPRRWLSDEQLVKISEAISAIKDR